MRFAYVLSFAAFAALATADEAYLGLYIGGKKIGYTTYKGTSEKLNGVLLRRSDSKMLMSTVMMGSDLKMIMDSTSWSTLEGHPVKMIFRIESGGRVQNIDAQFDKTNAKLVIDNSGEIVRSTIPLPTGAPIVDDALGAFLIDGIKPGAKRDFYVLDPTTASFIKNSAEVNGPSPMTINGKTSTATLVTIHDPRADTRVFLNAKGDFLKGEGPMGIEMIPESKESALNMTGTGEGIKLDIAESTSIKPDSPLKDPGGLKSLTVRIQGRDLASIPSDSYQTVKGKADDWTLAIHPPTWAKAKNSPLSELRTNAPAWLKPSLHVNSDKAQWHTVLRPVLANKQGLKATATAIHDFVYHRMKPNAGIGVLRDATEVYKTKEGVCRDYAVLTATLMRAAGVPARLASGLVSWDGTFYYHAWVEVWDGKGWYPIDSTSPDMQVSAAHIKLSQGNVEQAFSFPFLGRVKMHVLDAKR